MKVWLWLVLVLVACQSTPKAPPHLLGTVKVQFGSSLQTAALVPGGQLAFVRTMALSKTHDLANNRSFWTVQYQFTNNTTSTLDNVVLLAYNKTGNSAGSALGNIRNASSNAAIAAPDATAFANRARPSNPMSGAPLVVNNATADLQLFSESEIATLQSEAQATTGYLSSGENLLPYGFVLHQSRSDRSIGVGESATVNLALSIPDAGAASNYVFDMSFLVYANPLGTVRVAESIEEQGGQSGVVARRTALGSASIVAVQGTALLDSNPHTAFDNVRIATNQNALKQVTVSSLADSGTGSLREAIAGLGADGIVHLAFPSSGAQVLQLQSPLSISNKVIVSRLGSEIFAISGNNQSRIFEVATSGYLSLRGSLLFVADGQIDGVGGGCIENQGVLVLKQIGILNCSASSNNPAQRHVYGGAIYNTGVLRMDGEADPNADISQSQVTGFSGENGSDPSNASQSGGNGGNGGNGYGGAIYNSGSLEIRNFKFATSSGVALGGRDSTNGSNAANGGGGGDGGFGFFNGGFVSAGGNGGNGGNGYGGAIYSTNPIVQHNLFFANSSPNNLNLAQAGQRGNGGRGSPSGSNGTDGQAFSGSTTPPICIAAGTGCQ
jgi:hypothetical protein